LIAFWQYKQLLDLNQKAPDKILPQKNRAITSQLIDKAQHSDL
jgi:hypothetical protein